MIEGRDHCVSLCYWLTQLTQQKRIEKITKGGGEVANECKRDLKIPQPIPKSAPFEDIRQ